MPLCAAEDVAGTELLGAGSTPQLGSLLQIAQLVKQV